MDTGSQQDKIIEHLDMLNRAVTRQNSFRHMFAVGVVYGIGFVVGSAIIATIIIGLLGPWIGQIPAVRSAFESGKALIKQ